MELLASQLLALRFVEDQHWSHPRVIVLRQNIHGNVLRIYSATKSQDNCHLASRAGQGNLCLAMANQGHTSLFSLEIVHLTKK